MEATTDFDELSLIILSLPLLIWYPITKASHAKLRAGLMASER